MNNPTVGAWLATNTKLLEAANIRSARLDCVILLEQRLPHNRAQILAHLDDPLTDEQLQKLTNDIALRLQHKPVQYIVGFSEFYGRNFFVSEDVLVPRPESEGIISLLKLVPAPATIIDVGTGSGCLAITAKLELPNARVIALDIDDACLEIAQQNANQLGAKVETYRSDLLAELNLNSLPQPITLLANLPYVPTTLPVNAAATHEPKHALFGGHDGLDLYRRLFAAIRDDAAQPPQQLITEALTSQHAALAKLAEAHGYACTKQEGLAQLFEPVTS